MRAQAAICLLIIAALLVAPASARLVITAPFPQGATATVTKNVYAYTYDAGASKLAIQRMAIDVPIDGTADFTVTYGNGNTKSGTLAYSRSLVDPVSGFGYVTSDINYDGTTSTYTYASNALIGRYYLSGYARSENDNGTVISRGHIIFGNTMLSPQQVISELVGPANDYVYLPITGDMVITKVVITSDKPVTITLLTNSQSKVAELAQKSWLDILNEWIALAAEVATLVYNAVTSAIYWLKFFFVDNLILTVSGYFMLTMAFAARSARGNIPKFFRVWINDQKALLMFIVELYHILIGILNGFTAIFKP